jgi:hypothetical protein
MIIIVKIIFEISFLTINPWKYFYEKFFEPTLQRSIHWSSAKDFALTILIIASLPWNTKMFCKALVDTPSSKCEITQNELKMRKIRG